MANDFAREGLQGDGKSACVTRVEHGGELEVGLGKTGGGCDGVIPDRFFFIRPIREVFDEGLDAIDLCECGVGLDGIDVFRFSVEGGGGGDDDTGGGEKEGNEEADGKVGDGEATMLGAPLFLKKRVGQEESHIDADGGSEGREDLRFLCANDVVFPKC